MPQSITTTPTIHHRLAPRFAVNIEQHRITFLRIEVGRLHHPTVELHTLADVDFEELRRRLLQLRDAFLSLFVIDQRSRHAVLRQTHHFRHRNFVEARVNMNRDLAARRDVVTMHTGNTRRRQSFFPSAALNANAIQVTLRCVFRRSKKVDPAILRIHSLDTDHVVVARRDQLHVTAVARN